MKRTFKDFPESLHNLPSRDLEALYNYAYKYVSQDAMDVVHEALLTYSKNPIQPEKGATLLTLLTQQVKWACEDLVNRKKLASERHVSMAEAENIPVELPLNTMIDLREYVDKLDPRYKRIIYKLYYEGYTQEELGKELYLSLTRINQLHNEAINILRVYLKDYDRGV